MGRSPQDGHSGTTEEGTVAVSGSTVSYNTFTGTHWSRLADNSKPTILKGTVMETLDDKVRLANEIINLLESWDGS